MADPTAPHTIWEWMDWIWGFAMGVVGAIVGLLGWANTKLHTQDAKIETMNTKMIELEAQNKVNMALSQSVDRRLEVLDNKTDEQTKILHQVVGELKAMQSERMRGQ